MPFCPYRRYEVYYELQGAAGTPVIVFINGLTQRTQHWAAYVKTLTAAGYQVLCYDLLGQGKSSKPIIGVDFEGNAELLAALLDHLKIAQAYVAGISFGGIIVLRFGIRYPERARGLMPMSTFSEMDAQIAQTGANLYEGMTRCGFEYLIKLLVPLNFSARWIAQNEAILATIRRLGTNNNDLYAIQNLMESLRDFKGFTPELAQITSPTLIMNGEYDSFTPRSCHEILRQNIKNSRLLVMQHVYHAFTLEIPDITCRVIADFVRQVEANAWNGDQSVWVASDTLAAEKPCFPCPGDHRRCIPVALPNHN